MSEANDDNLDCDNCEYGREPVYSSQINQDAINTWTRLDLFGRDLDGYSGVPKPLKIEAIIAACRESYDPVGLKWRIMLFEEHIYSKRVKEYNAKAAKRNKGAK